MVTWRTHWPVSRWRLHIIVSKLRLIQFSEVQTKWRGIGRPRPPFRPSSLLPRDKAGWLWANNWSLENWILERTWKWSLWRDAMGRHMGFTFAYFSENIDGWESLKSHSWCKGQRSSDEWTLKAAKRSSLICWRRADSRRAGKAN